MLSRTTTLKFKYDLFQQTSLVALSKCILCLRTSARCSDTVSIHESLILPFCVVYIIRQPEHEAKVHLLNVANRQIEMLPLKAVNFYAPDPVPYNAMAEKQQPFICVTSSLLPSNNLAVSEMLHDGLKSLLRKYCRVHSTN